jgi:hypothetical protein
MTVTAADMVNSPFISAGKTVAEIAHPAGKSREISSAYE